MEKKIRAAVIGVGYLGKFHAEKYAAMDNVELAGVVDSHRGRAEEIGRHVGVPAFDDYRNLFGRVDAVSVAAPTPLHFEIGKAFLAQGVDVLMEKPITTTLEEADALIDIAEKTGRILQVGHLERFNPAVRAVKSLITHPVFIESSRMSLYKERGTDVSVVLDLMIHDIDIISHFVHSGIKYCHAMGASVVSDTVDIANAHIEFDNGAVAKVTASRIANKNERKIRLFQKEGYISLDFANRSIVHVRPGVGEDNCPIPGMHMEERRFME
ncbi:MAG: Gfo/Idh/MocA family oxidoreductase, partial [Desulfobacteraceae bacterium]|nr:Gfo/Idh/MocA family oxidoreductase [Desulfobacteraceae bacterium]